MTSAQKTNKILHPEFARRMAQACDGNPDVPPENYGRLGWFASRIERKPGEFITQESVRKWFAGESIPRQKVLIQLAKLLKVEPAWLAMGRAPELTEKQARVRNAAADGAVNVVAGFVRMCGSHPAFPTADDARATEQKIDLYAIIRGAQYAFHVVTGDRVEGGWKVAVPVDARETFVIAVLPVTDLHCEFVELPWDSIEAEGTRKGGMFEVSIPSELEGKPWSRIKTFAERL